VEVNVAEDKLREFYLRAGQPLSCLYEWRAALVTNEQGDAQKTAEGFSAVMELWTSEIIAVQSYLQREEDYRMVYGVWNHGGQPGPPPTEPAWPTEIPDYFEAMMIVEHFMHLRDGARYPHCVMYDADQIGAPLSHIIRLMDNLKQLIEAPEEDESDGTIDRNQLAALIKVSAKTLANRAAELPEPIARTTRQVPIYMYLAARAALSKMYPDKAFMLPEFAEINWASLPSV
jgi:hypothetical protein